MVSGSQFPTSMCMFVGEWLRGWSWREGTLCSICFYSVWLESKELPTPDFFSLWEPQLSLFAVILHVQEEWDISQNISLSCTIFSFKYMAPTKEERIWLTVHLHEGTKLGFKYLWLRCLLSSAFDLEACLNYYHLVELSVVIELFCVHNSQHISYQNL